MVTGCEAGASCFISHNCADLGGVGMFLWALLTVAPCQARGNVGLDWFKRANGACEPGEMWFIRELSADIGRVENNP